MPEFPEYSWAGYKLRLRPSDRFRKSIGIFGLEDFLNYFDSSQIQLDLRVSIPKRKDTKDITDTIKYEWILCTADDKPVAYSGDPRFKFYNTCGNGVFPFSTTRPKSGTSQSGDISWYDDGIQIFRRQPQAVNIGNISQLAHYKVIMQFSNSAGVASGYQPMAHFTVMDKDSKRDEILSSGIIPAIVAAVLSIITTVILHYVFKY